MVIEVLSGFKGLSPFKDATVDDKWDQVNRCYVFLFMVLMGTVTTMRQYSGTLIACDGFTKFHPQFAEDFCWTVGMYTIKEAYNMPSYMVPYPGVLPNDIPSCLPRLLKNGTLKTCPSEKDVLPAEKVFHLWYQWASFWFWLVAIAYYTPYILFKQLGGGDYKPLIKMLAIAEMSDEKNMTDVQDKVVHWLFYRFKVYMMAKGYHAWWRRNSFSFVFMFVKLTYLFVTVAVFWLTGHMFEYGNWYTYGAEWAGTRFTPYHNKINESTTLSRDILFPKMVACEIMRWGPTGLETETAQCVLAPNVLYQYLFLFAWFVLVMTFFSNVISVLLHTSEMFFVNGTYNRMIGDAMLPDKPSYRFVFNNVGSGGREILQILTDNSNPMLFGRIYDSLVTLLVKEASDDYVIDNMEAMGAGFSVSEYTTSTSSVSVGNALTVK